jgi:hypothetical protein
MSFEQLFKDLNIFPICGMYTMAVMLHGIKYREARQNNEIHKYKHMPKVKVPCSVLWN